MPDALDGGPAKPLQVLSPGWPSLAHPGGVGGLCQGQRRPGETGIEAF